MQKLINAMAVTSFLAFGILVVAGVHVYVNSEEYKQKIMEEVMEEVMGAIEIPEVPELPKPNITPTPTPIPNVPFSM